ncbi:MAG: C-GCAxxG-C-C family protein [Eubacteriales bacterium]|nr:C-GCAxxG-C-C family protein [Eubacteriales bacterium]
MSRVEKAMEYHKKGYNCSQSIVCTFADKLGMEEQDLFKIAEGLGLGVGDTCGTCGAVTGMALVLGMTNSTGNLEAPNSKAATYRKVKEMNDNFRKKNGSTICRELKGLDTGKILRSCDGCIEDAVVFLENELGD